MKRRIRDLTYAPFSTAVSYSKYLSYCMVFEDVFKRYTVDQPTIVKDTSDPQKAKETDLFSLQFTAEAEEKMCMRLLEKLKTEKLVLSGEEKNDTIVLTVYAILSLWSLGDKIHNKYGLVCKQLLRTLDSLFQLREQDAYIRYVAYAVERFNLIPERAISINPSAIYIDSLFGYKSKEKLVKFLKGTYGEQATVILDIPNKDVFIRTIVTDIGQYMRMKEGPLKELDGFCCHWGIPKFQIRIENGKSRFEYRSPNATGFVVYDGNCEKKVLIQTMRSFAGKETKKNMNYTL